MIRKIIHIDEALCNGCGACAAACHEGAIGMVGGKARLLREDYCDGLGDCLPACPAGAIRFEEREAAAYDAAAVQKSRASGPLPCGCPGTAARTLTPPAEAAAGGQPSQLRQFPVQLQLVPVRAPWFDGCDLLVAADCTACACGDFHARLLRGRILLIACPKLDTADYSEKLEAIFRANRVRSVTVARMTVPCCGGLERAVRTALTRSGSGVPLRVVAVSPDGAVTELRPAAE